MIEVGACVPASRRVENGAVGTGGVSVALQAQSGSWVEVRFEPFADHTTPPFRLGVPAHGVIRTEGFEAHEIRPKVSEATRDSVGGRSVVHTVKDQSGQMKMTGVLEPIEAVESDGCL